MTKYITLRTLIFVVCATGAVATAVDLAMKQGLTVPQMIATASTALAAFALRWPSDVTAAEAKEREARARRESIMPPPSQETRDLVELLRDAKLRERDNESL